MHDYVCVDDCNHYGNDDVHEDDIYLYNYGYGLFLKKFLMHINYSLLNEK
ncbi:hypothetical protein [Sulfurimonas sp.]|nr:hypothetical protein [Sulfurimonas sp.]